MISDSDWRYDSINPWERRPWVRALLIDPCSPNRDSEITASWNEPIAALRISIQVCDVAIVYRRDPCNPQFRQEAVDAGGACRLFLSHLRRSSVKGCSMDG